MRMRASASPMMPSPIFLVSRVFSLIFRIGNLFTSMTASRNCTPRRVYGPHQILVQFALRDAPREVDAPQVAAFKGQEWLLAAGIRGFQVPKAGHSIFPVDGIEEEHTGVATPPCCRAECVPEPARVDAASYRTVPGIRSAHSRSHAQGNGKNVHQNRRKD